MNGPEPEASPDPNSVPAGNGERDHSKVSTYLNYKTDIMRLLTSRCKQEPQTEAQGNKTESDEDEEVEPGGFIRENQTVSHDTCRYIPHVPIAQQM